MPLTVRKDNELTYAPGGAQQLKPKTPSIAKKYAEVIRDDYHDELDPISSCTVSIAVVVRESTKFLECELMDKNMAVPNTTCMFYVRVGYQWRRKDSATDYDEVLTDGERFFLVNRSLGESPFILNDHTKRTIVTAITQYAGAL